MDLLVVGWMAAGLGAGGDKGMKPGLARIICRPAAHWSFVIPMPSGKVRSLNLATATGIVLYEGLRQLHGW
jgi:tRNA(Leu) C34 or U34 (ribose-2'-O)-methylase TrmL